MNCIWILLLLCLCNGNGSGGCSDHEMDCRHRRNSRRNDRGDCDDDRRCENNRDRRKDSDCDCDEVRKDTCNRDRDDRREDRRDDRRFPMPPFAPEAGRCCEASESSVRENGMEEYGKE